MTAEPHGKDRGTHDARGSLGGGRSELDVYARARKIRDGIDEPGFVAELDQGAMAFRADCARTGKTVFQAAEEIFRAADEDPDGWARAEAIAAWAVWE